MKPLSEIYKERGLQGTILQLPEPLQRYSIDIEQAKVYDNLKERWLKGKVEHDGYTRTSFKMNGVVKSFTVHRLIAYAICGRILDKDELVLHMDEGYGKGNINNTFALPKMPYKNRQQTDSMLFQEHNRHCGFGLFNTGNGEVHRHKQGAHTQMPKKEIQTNQRVLILLQGRLD